MIRRSWFDREVTKHIDELAKSHHEGSALRLEVAGDLSPIICPGAR